MADDVFSKSSDSNRRGSRLLRYADVSRRMGNLAARVAGERYLGFDIDRTRHAKDLKEALGGLKGTFLAPKHFL